MSLTTQLSRIARAPGDPRVVWSGPSAVPPADRLAKGLGWFGIALGIVQLVAPRRIARGLGMRGQEGLVRACGAREVASGMMCLSIDRPAGAATRVAGDAMDIALLMRAMHWRNPQRGNVAMALVAVLGITMLDIAAGSGLALRHRRGGSAARDYADRSGFPKGVAAARGAARRTKAPVG